MKIFYITIIVIQAALLEFYAILLLRNLIIGEDWTNQFAKIYVMLILAFMVFFIIYCANMFIDFELYK